MVRLSLSKKSLASPFGRGGPRQRAGEGSGFSLKIQKSRIFAMQISDNPSQSCCSHDSSPKGGAKK